MTAQIKLDAIAGHESAIATYTQVIGDLMPMQRNGLIETLINQYLETIEILRQELLEMKDG